MLRESAEWAGTEPSDDEARHEGQLPAGVRTGLHSLQDVHVPSIQLQVRTTMPSLLESEKENNQSQDRLIMDVLPRCIKRSVSVCCT